MFEFARLNVFQLAQRLGRSLRTIYALVPTKNDCVLAASPTFFENLAANAQLARANCDAPEKRIFEYLAFDVRAAQRLNPAVIAAIDTGSRRHDICGKRIRGS